MQVFVEKYIKDPFMLTSIIGLVAFILCGIAGMFFYYGTTVGLEGLMNQRQYLICAMAASIFVMIASAAFGFKQVQFVKNNEEPDLPPIVLIVCFAVFGIALALSYTGYSACQKDLNLGVIEEELVYQKTLVPLNRPGTPIRVLPEHAHLVFVTNTGEEKDFDIHPKTLDDYNFLEEGEKYRVISYPITEILVDINKE